MDFYQICTKTVKNSPAEIYPDFVVVRSKDLMVRGRSFYAIWDEAQQLWSTDEYDVQRLVDEDLRAYADEYQKDGASCTVKYLRSFHSNSWNQFRRYIQNISDNSHQLDENLIFANTEVKKADYVSRRLPYSLQPGDHSAWDELVGALYSDEERAKIEWVIGAIVAGDAKKIQKFLVFYGPPASGKSTILNVVQKLFSGYTTTFDAKALGSAGSAFATEVFKNNPLVAIQHDGDLSKIDDNARLNSIISHEEMPMNEKYKAGYTAKVNAFLLMGTNQPVRISDAKSGIIRRLIDVHPTGNKIPVDHYHALMARIDFELGAIAHYCHEVYLSMGKNYYNAYRPTEMMLQTDVFFNFIEAYYDVFKRQNSTTLKQAYAMYKEYCGETGIERVLPQYKMREELRNYFDEFHERATVEGEHIRSYYQGFNANKFKVESKVGGPSRLVLEEETSIFDREFEDMPAQLATKAGIPSRRWLEVKTTLADIDTRELHYVKVPEDHIVIDFDLKDENGEKSLEKNLEAASLWPATYAELSQGSNGVHLHYTYEGDVTQLSHHYDDGIEIKTLLGDASLRRRLTRCNNVPISPINSGLPFKEQKLLAPQVMKSERSMRNLIARAMNKEFSPGTKSACDFIKKILDDAHDQGMTYDVSDLQPRLIAFANSSSTKSLTCLKTVQTMKFKSDDVLAAENKAAEASTGVQEGRLVFYDVEVYPNLFIVCWKFAGEANIVRMINPTALEIEQLFKMKLVGFNNRRYDNHILWGRYMGYDNEQLYKLSQKIISGNVGAMFGEAYNLSYTDIWDFNSIKKGLKWWMIKLGLPHLEMDIPWDQPVPEETIPKVVEYCCNDVTGTEAVFEARKQDFVARQILADLSGLTLNDTTQKHTARIIFGNDRNPQAKFVYTELNKEFPGYEFHFGKSTYRGEDPSEGGYVYAEPGLYSNVSVLDVASMHPTSIIQLNLFGEYTPNFAALMDARLAIKRRDYDSARKMLNGKLAPHLENPDEAAALAYALKIVINIVYGLTSAKFSNAFKDIRNVDNIVAKRGALFMIDLKHACQEKGLQVVHIKTDSIKIPNASQEDIDEIMVFGAKYGYTFEHEATYDKFCLVNDAVYIAREGDHWEAVGAQFQHPYVYKTLFSHEPITFDDMCETRQVTKGAMYMDFTHDRPIALEEGMQFIGRTGRFVPVAAKQGASLWRVHEGKQYAVSGSKGYRWLEATVAATFGDDLEIDVSYFEAMVDAARKTIEKFGPFEELMS